MDTSDIINWFETACGKCASAIVDDFKRAGCSLMVSDKHRAMLINAENNGVQDLEGWLGDELHSDYDFQSDMIGDRVYGIEDERVMIEQLAKHPNYKKWADKYLEQNSERI